MIQLLVAGLTVGSTYALVALGIHIILRATRAINFAQGDFVVLGGLFALSFVQVLHVNIWVALLGSTILGFALGGLYERFILRAAARVSEGAVMIASIGTVYLLLYGHAMIWGNEPQPLPTFSSAQQIALGGARSPSKASGSWRCLRSSSPCSSSSSNARRTVRPSGPRRTIRSGRD